MIRKRWVLRGGQAENRALAASLSQEEELPPFAAMMALGRGIAPEELPGFLGLAEEPMCNPYDFPDMEAAIERIERALALGEHITVFGDYDADGVSSTALLYHYLSSKTEHVDYYLPDRQKEGYGLSMAAIDCLAQRGTKLLVTVDNGVSALREIAHAKALGIATVVTDHHQVGGALPECAAVVNPHRTDCDMPFKDYTGVGLAFLLVCALEGCEPEELLPAWGELVALGTVADVAPLLGDNRAFARAGLAILTRALVRKGVRVRLVELDPPLEEQLQFGDKGMRPGFQHNEAAFFHGFQLVGAHQRTMGHLQLLRCTAFSARDSSRHHRPTAHGFTDAFGAFAARREAARDG